MASLEVIQGENVGKIYQLGNRETVVGRLPGCDVVLRETTVSRRHARIVREADHYYVEDLHSHHGTLVNGRRITLPERLRHRDQIQISQSLLRFYHSPTDEGVPFANDSERSSTVIDARRVLSESHVHDEQYAKLKLNALLEIIHNVGVSLDVEQLFPEILDSVFRIFPQADRGYILLAGESDEQLIPHAVKQRDDTTSLRPLISGTMARRVMSGEAIVTEDAGDDERFQMSESVYQLDLRSVMCAPLLGGRSSKPLGLIHVDTRKPHKQFTMEDLEVLVNVANLAGKAIDHAQLHKTQLQFQEREHDIQTARQVQRHFLPQERPQVEQYELYDYYEAAEGVGGDYFGYIPLPSGRLAIAIGDVAGKGVSAALLMARLCSDVRYCLVTNATPAAAVQTLSRQISKLGEYNRFITFTLCVLDPQGHEVEVVNAGHMPPLLHRASDQAVEAMGDQISGPPLGVAPHWEYQQTTVALRPGDAVVLYTDGVSEAMNVEGQMFGNQRVRQLLGSPGTPHSFVERIKEAVHQFARDAAQFDDICLLSFGRNLE